MPEAGPLDLLLARCAAEGAPAPIAAMRLMMAAESAEAAGAALDRALAPGRPPEDAERLRPVAELVAANPQAWAAVRAVASAVDHAPVDGGGAVDHWARLFDMAVALSPEASVALYSLGGREMLAALTAETVALLDGWGLLAPAARVLDVGCGIGRLGEALSPRVGSVLGLDISAGMIAEAERRCAGLGNLAFQQANGRDLAGVADGSVDLVLMVDVFPYLMLSPAEGLAARHLAEAARVLGRGGELVVLNCSYREDFAADVADLSTMGGAAGLDLRRAIERPFQGWDAPAFRLGKLDAPPLRGGGAGSPS